MAHPRLGSCVKNEKGNSGRWRTERGKKGRRVAGPFTMLHARIKQRVNGQTNERRTRSEAAPHRAITFANAKCTSVRTARLSDVSRWAGHQDGDSSEK